MKILLSPAKSLNLDSDYPEFELTQPQFLAKTEKLHNKLKGFTPQKIGELMSISAKLSELNYDRFQNFDLEHDMANSRPAIFTFNGDVYDGLNAYNLEKEDVLNLQDRLRILSGLYGMLRPLDIMQAYRLEMGTTLKINRASNLYEFWQKDLTIALNNELASEELVVNLASKEYSKAIDKKSIKGQWIEPVFKDYKNGKLKIISFYAKKARGMMTRHLAKIENPDYQDILRFNEDNYAFSKEQTKSSAQPVFVR
jgi:cytoplasmic iron level regulating protein YaaA (DUF328/UPF0246 family)